MAKKTTKKAGLPTLAEQAEKELKRLERAAKRAGKRGYTFNLAPLSQTKGGKKRQRWTKKAVAELKGLKTKNLYKYATGPGGISGEEWRKKEQQEAARKAAETRKRKAEEAAARARAEADRKAAEEWEKANSPYTPLKDSEVIIDNFLTRANWEPISNIQYDILNGWLDNEIRMFGEDIVAEALEAAINDGTVYELRGRYKEYITVRLSVLEDYIDAVYAEHNEGEETERAAAPAPSESQDDMDAEAHTVDRFGEDQESEIYHFFFG